MKHLYAAILSVCALFRGSAWGSDLSLSYVRSASVQTERVLFRDLADPAGTASAQ